MSSMDISQISPPEPFKALIFDCDGTLADTMPAHARSWAATYKTFGIEIAEQPFLEMGGLPNRAIIEKLNQEHGYTLDVSQTQEEKERRYLEMLHSVVEITAVADIARAYRGRVPMAVASSGLGRVVHQTLTTTGLLPLFDVVVTADDVVHGKPSPDIFLLAAARLGIAPADCIVYEDGDPGLEAARRAGMRAVDVRVLWRPNTEAGS
jgi:HAD superfamily hydrolase (TIGR01509 family)